MRQLTKLDEFIGQIDTALRTLLPPMSRLSNRANPGDEYESDVSMSTRDIRHVAGLMRVNHAGEVCAQALYQGQALTAELSHVKAQMITAAAEEVDHLAWCEQRLRELNSHPSVLNIIWYSGSFLLGAIAGIAGDRWSLGFVAETERQVTNHLRRHISMIPETDVKTRAILTKMQEDEMHHAETAEIAGAAQLPGFIKSLMMRVSMLLTRSSYHI